MQEFLESSPIYYFRLTHVCRLSEALQLLQSQPYEVILLDLTLPDSDGLSSLSHLLSQVQSIAVVVLTHTNNPELAIEAVRQGAQDYLVKRFLNQEVLVRSLRYAIERKQQAEALRRANEALEARVASRTSALETANRRLRQEIAHRQAVQERLILAQKVANIGLFEWEIAPNKMTWSAELEGLYGLPQSTFDGRYESWIKTLHEEDRSAVEQALWRAVSFKSGLNTEFRIVHPTSGIRWIAIKSSYFAGDDLPDSPERTSPNEEATRRPARILGIHMDVTDKKQLEAQFLQAQRLESLGTLASGIAHDLNNILTPILGASQLLPLMMPGLNEQSQELIEMLSCSAQRGTKLVQQILSFARGNTDLRQVLSLSDLLSEIERIVAQTLPRSITIEVEIPDDLWHIRGDDTQLHQVFMNLCVNARDAMPHGGKLSVVAHNLMVDEPYVQMQPEARIGSYVVVTVRDTGMGMPPEILGRIFDPFFTTKASGQGTGLGLAAVMGIVKGHGGFLDVRSAVGEGSQFRVFLPADSGDVSDGGAPLTLVGGQQALVLVVDDEPAICQVIQLALENHGYRVLVAHDGLEAIALLAEQRQEISAVLIDLIMPDMDGRTAIPLLQRLAPEVPIAVMTGAIGPMLTEQMVNLKVQGSVQKPFTSRELLTVLQEIRAVR